MNKVIEEAEEWLDTPYFNASADLSAAENVIGNLITELESKNKELERLEAVVEAARYFANEGDGRADRMLSDALSQLEEKG